MKYMLYVELNKVENPLETFVTFVKFGVLLTVHLEQIDFIYLDFNSIKSVFTRYPKPITQALRLITWNQ
jgi:hypothetical protein